MSALVALLAFLFSMASVNFLQIQWPGREKDGRAHKPAVAARLVPEESARPDGREARGGESEESAGADTGAKKAPEKGQGETADEGPLKEDGGAATFDVARVNPDGISVFAGRAAPDDTVTVLADGKPIGTAKADENGEWSLAVEKKLEDANAELSLSIDPKVAKSLTGEDAKGAGGEGSAAGAPAKVVALERKDRPASEAVKEVTAGMIRNLEGLVDAARKSAAQEVEAGARGAGTEIAAADTKSHEGNEGEVAQEAGEAGTGDGGKLSGAIGEPAMCRSGDAAQSSSWSSKAEDEPSRVPVPIMFVYREATFTTEGERAVRLLLEYLKLKSFQSVKLTGHADERGSPQLNMGLSRDRLEAVARYLKTGGFTGALDLVPKGESEPFSGVDRTRYSSEDLYQLDRRVELRVAR
jgi:outer membrane protein OmpA-like peptidoglycan-associated protein